MKSWPIGLRLLLALLCLGQAGAAWAAACSAVFPAARTANSSATLDLGGLSWASSPALTASNRSLGAGAHYFAGGSGPNDWLLSATGGASTRVFVNGSLTLGNNSQLNAGGNPEDLIFVVNGSLTLGNNVQINGFVYVTGSIDYGNNLILEGAVTALGATDSPGGSSSLSYAGGAIELAEFANLCAAEDRELYLRFDETSWSGLAGEAFDSSGNGNAGRARNGALTGNATPALSGSSGTCRYGDFIGGSSHVEVPHDGSLDFRSALSIGFWIRPTQTPTGTVVLLSKGDNYKLELNSQRRLVLSARFVYGLFGSTETLQLTSSRALALDSWSHVGMVLRLDEAFLLPDRLVGQLYLDGALNVSGQTSAQYFGTSRPNTSSLRIAGDGASGLGGAIDEVRLDQDLLSASDFAEQMAARHPCASEPTPIDHFRFEHAGNALTCNPLDVRVRACQDSDCTTPYSAAVAVSLNPSGWVGGSSQTLSTGSALIPLRVTSAGRVTLGLSSSTPAASNAPRCYIAGQLQSDCQVWFADSSFILEVPPLTSAKPASASLRAVKKDDATQTCVAGFGGGTRSLQFSSAYSNPSSGTQPVLVNGISVGATPTAVSLSFDANASAPLTVRYDDAGLMNLAASYSGSDTNGDAGLSMTGSASFVAKPYGFCLETNASCTVADTSASCPPFPGARAGDPFELRIRAVGWEVDGEDGAVLCSGNIVTPNFQLNNIGLSSQLVAPSAGSNASLLVSRYDHGLGNQTRLTQSISEVGVFSLRATPTSPYFGETLSASSSGYIGRFIPKYLGASGSASLTPSCGSFSYQGQPMAFAGGQEPSLTVTGFNADGGVTSNYDRGDFWRLDTPARDAYLSVTGKASLDAAGRLTRGGTAVVSQSGADTGDGARTFHWSGETLHYTPASVPSSDDLPFTAAVRQGFASLADADGVCYGDGSSCQAFSYDFLNSPGSQVRLGRLRLGNAHGSELQGLDLPLLIESWQGSAASGYFAQELADGCSAPELNTPALVAGTFTGNLAAGETTPSLSAIALGQGQLQLSVPGAGNDGSVQATLSMPQWLWYDWDGSATRQAPRGLASFGIYSGPQRLIFRRELYR